jgi:peptidoglycan/LPS O-acetylase OafA/YrhL
MTTNQKPRYQSLDLWRGLICSFVVLEHAAVALWDGASRDGGSGSWLRWVIVAPFQLNLGTPLFFVISPHAAKLLPSG